MKPQSARVLAVLRQRPVTLADFDCQPACDGGDRITRLGARIQDLKDDGYRLHSERIGHIARYTLIAEPETSGEARCGLAYPVTSPCRSVSKKQVPGTPAPEPASLPPAARAQLQPIGPQLSLLDGMAA